MIIWDEINFPDEWLLTAVVSPKPVIKTDLDQIAQAADIKVEVRFNSKQMLGFLLLKF